MIQYWADDIQLEYNVSVLKCSETQVRDTFLVHKTIPFSIIVILQILNRAEFLRPQSGGSGGDGGIMGLMFVFISK